MGKQRLAKYRAQREHMLKQDARMGRNKFGLARPTAPRSNTFKGGVQRQGVIGFVVNSKGNSVVQSRIYRDPNYDAIEQVSDLLMPSESVPLEVARGRREQRRITPQFGRGSPSLFDQCMLIESKPNQTVPTLRDWLYRFTETPAMVFERRVYRSPAHKGRTASTYGVSECLPTHAAHLIKYHWPTGTLPPYQCVDTRASERERLADAIDLWHLARTEAAQQVSDHWPYPVDWSNGAPSVE